MKTYKWAAFFLFRKWISVREKKVRICTCTWYGMNAIFWVNVDFPWGYAIFIWKSEKFKRRSLCLPYLYHAKCLTMNHIKYVGLSKQILSKHMLLLTISKSTSNACIVPDSVFSVLLWKMCEKKNCSLEFKKMWKLWRGMKQQKSKKSKKIFVEFGVAFVCIQTPFHFNPSEWNWMLYFCACHWENWFSFNGCDSNWNINGYCRQRQLSLTECSN